MFQNTKRTDWLQDIRKVIIIIDDIVFCEDDVMPLSLVQYWQVSTVVLRAMGTASNEQNKDSSRIVG